MRSPTLTLPKLGVGLAYQAALAPLLAVVGPELDYVEVVPDILWTDLGRTAEPRYVDDRAGRSALEQASCGRPIVAHGIGLSIGSAGAFDAAHVEQVERWRRRLGFPWHSDHLAFHLAEHGDALMNVGITLPLPRDRESIELLVPRLREVRQRVPVPFLLENNVYYFDIPACEMDEPTFLNTLCRESGCGLVLDLHNVYTNARNHGFDAAAMLAELELEHVGEIHVAGGMELDGFYLDAHSDTIPDPVWSLLEWTLPRCPNLGGVTFELFGSWFESVGNARITADLRRLRALWTHVVHPAPRRCAAVPVSALAFQTALARLIVDPDFRDAVRGDGVAALPGPLTALEASRLVTIAHGPGRRHEPHPAQGLSLGKLRALLPLTCALLTPARLRARSRPSGRRIRRRAFPSCPRRSSSAPSSSGAGCARPTSPRCWPTSARPSSSSVPGSAPAPPQSVCFRHDPVRLARHPGGGTATALGAAPARACCSAARTATPRRAGPSSMQ
jgi:uncharacterized protein (UPF0276 family)